MRRLAQRLGLEVPRYVRRDAVVVGHQQHSSGGSSGAGGGAGAASGKRHQGGAGNGMDGLQPAAAGAAVAVKQESKAGQTGEAEAAEGSSGSSGTSSSAGSDTSSSSSDGEGGGGRPAAIPFSVFVQSSHGPKCPMPMVQSVDFAFDVSRRARRGAGALGVSSGWLAGAVTAGSTTAGLHR